MNDSGDSSPPPSPVESAPADPEPPESLSVAIVEEGGDWSAFGTPSCTLEAAVRAAAAAVAAHPGCAAARGAQACVVLADDALVRSLNRAYRGKDAPTNVLSFPFQAPPGVADYSAMEPRQLGDVVLAAETVRGEAEALGVGLVPHAQHLVVHGLLHLLDFNHDTDSDAEIMEGLEVEILATLGVADPYAAAAGR